MIAKCIKFFVWFIVFMVVLTAGTKAMTASNTWVAILGLAGIALFIILSCWTYCFTTIHIKLTKRKKEEK